MSRPLSDGEREILAELEADARSIEEAEADPDDTDIWEPTPEELEQQARDIAALRSYYAEEANLRG